MHTLAREVDGKGLRNGHHLVLRGDGQGLHTASMGSNENGVAIDAVVQGREPSAKLATIWGLWLLQAPVRLPFSSSGRMASEIRSECTPRSRRSVRVLQRLVRDLAQANLQGGAIVDDAGNVARNALHVVFLQRLTIKLGDGVCTGTSRWMRLMCRVESPCERGMAG